MKYVLKNYDDLLEKVEKMTVDELLLSVIMPNIIVGQNEMPKDAVSVFLHPTTTEKAKAATSEINADREIPALIVSDMEYGAGGAIQDACAAFPSMMAVAKTNEDRLAYEMGVLAAKEALEAGYHWTFGPCVDILMNHSNPVVNFRTAGDDADTVIKYGGAYMRGLQDTGLIATLKHFPGDGCDENDQHLALTVNPLSKEDWDASFGKVYSTLIEQGAMAVMPGHISLPAYDTPDVNGICPPATVSKKLLTDLLKNKLGFDGIICSDGTNMGGFCGYRNLYEAAAMFLEAGGDCLIFVHGTNEYLTEMKKHIDSGLLTVDALKNRAYRMMCFARHYFEMSKERESAPLDRAYAESVALEVVNKSLEVDYDRVGLLPYSINKDSRIAHIILANPGMPTAVAKDFTEALKKITENVAEFSDPGPDALHKLAKSGEYDLIICSVIAGACWGLNTAKLSGRVARNMMWGWTRMGTPALFVSFYSPYFKEQYFASVDTLINTYGVTEYTVDAVINKITGKL